MMRLPSLLNHQSGSQMYKSYIHIERFGTDEVDGIELGTCHIFPKLDGTNAVVWYDGERVRCGSRNREISIEEDNAGFAKFVEGNVFLQEYASQNEGCYIYGEWLVPHTIKNYRDDAWRRFYIFDIQDSDGSFVNYDTWSPNVPAGSDIIVPIAIVKNPTYEDIQRYAAENFHLIDDKTSPGEGVVLKRYDYVNRFGRTTWAKFVNQKFKESHVRTMGAPERENKLIEEAIVGEFVNEHLVAKIIDKIRTEKESFEARDIPRLLGSAFHDLVTEEMWQIVKQHKNPKIDFKTLNYLTIQKVKQLRHQLFGLSA